MNQDTDMRPAIIAKSDQLNAEDLMGGPITIVITEARVRAGQDQPVTINYQNDNGKPYKPCKSMSRVMVQAWGPDSSLYSGKAMTLFLDPNVKWGGVMVGGIRISHLSHIEKKMTLALTETRGKRKPYQVDRLDPVGGGQQNDNRDLGKQEQSKQELSPEQKRQAWVNNYIGKVNACTSLDGLTALQDEQRSKLDQFRDKYPDLWKQITDAQGDTYERLTPSDGDEDDGAMFDE